MCSHVPIVGENVISSGQIIINVKYGVVHSYTDEFDLCDLVTCPVKRGMGWFDFENPIKPFAHPVS